MTDTAMELPTGFVRTERVGRILARALLAAGWTAAALAAWLLVSGRGGREMAGWMVHGGCFSWDATTMAVWITGNLGTALCYALIPVLLYFARQLQSLPVWVIASFETFILFCGTGHVVKVWTLWNSDYVAAGVLDLATFLVSIPAAIGLGLTIWQARLSRGEVQKAQERAQSAEDSRDVLLERLQASNTDLERFAYAASHDLQEPLRAVQSYARLVREDYGAKLDAQGSSWLGNVEESAARGQRMVEELLGFSRLSSGGRDFVAVPLREPLDEAMARLRLALEEAGAEVQIGELPVVYGDSSQLAVVFQNLLGNALKYRGDGPVRMEVAAAAKGERVVVRVFDEGVGIPEEGREAVFEVFRRLHSEAQVPGTGLGLAMCRRVLERHGGRIEVVDSPDGRTCIEFDLPARGDG